MTEGPTRLLLITLVALVPALAHAELDLGMNLTSRYLHRGINLSGDGPALQGKVEYSSAIGLYAGVWGSTVESPFDDRRYEFDFFAGYQHRFNPGLALDATLIRYTYQGGGVSSVYDWTEAQLTAHLLDNWSFTVSRAENWASQGEITGTVEATYRYALTPRWLFDGTLGHAGVGDAVGYDYQWGELGLTRQLGNLHARLAYSATRNFTGPFDLGRDRWLISVGWQLR